MKKTVLLCILDGWGIGENDADSNSIMAANLPNYNSFLKYYPNSKISTSGLDVGLPDGQIGNSEVGHMTIGAGRVIYQDLPRINNAIKDGNLEKNDDLKLLVKEFKNTDKRCHLMGLFSDGGVHSHIDHIKFIAKFLLKNNVKVYLHAFLDGRDVAQKSAINYLKIFLEEFDEYNDNLMIASSVGRYYAMDRDNKIDRTTLAFDAIISGSENVSKDMVVVDDFIKYVEDNYKQNITDEFIKPGINKLYKGFKDGDNIIFCNFRADRARQISTMFLENVKNVFHPIALTEYSEKLNKFYNILFPPFEIKNSLPEILSANSLSQLRIAETEKYAHVTFFFSCGKEDKFPLEDRILIKSPDVPTYDLQPEMSSKDVGAELIKAIRSGKYDFIVVNYANPDMVGHSGILEASIKACEAIDEQLGILAREIKDIDGSMIITADHGNVECMIDENNNPHTSHTTNLVPFILIKNDVKNIITENGTLADIAPTILTLLNIPIPKEMSGKNLIKK